MSLVYFGNICNAALDHHDCEAQTSKHKVNQVMKKYEYSTLLLFWHLIYNLEEKKFDLLS